MRTMKEGKVGVWLIGALGSIATTVIVGTLLLRQKLASSTGMVSAAEIFDDLGMVSFDDLIFGGCDIRTGKPADAAAHLVRETRLPGSDFLARLQPDLSEMERDLRLGTALNCGEAIRNMADIPCAERLTVREEIQRVRSWLREFKESRGLRDVIVVNLASTEPFLSLQDYHSNLQAFERQLDANNCEAVRASTIYAYAAVAEGFSYINFTPSNAALVDAVVQLAEEKGAPVMGNDGKTGETLVKSALAPMFSCRNLNVLSWEGFNLLGNMDGCILDHPDNRESKIKTKDQVLSRILGYSPHSRVHIHYVPSLDDQKTAWDFIHFEGFLGAKMSLQFTWQGYDSLLAAPLVLDLVRFADLAKRRGEGGLMPHLASFFKAPVGVSEYRLYQQYEMLLAYARKPRGVKPCARG